MSTEEIQVVRLWCNGSCPDHATDGERAGYGVAFRSDDEDQGEYEVESGEIDYGSDVKASVAHYESIINGLQIVRERYDDQQLLRVELHSNAQNVIEQINGRNETKKSHTIALHSDVHAELDHFEEWTAKYVRRTDSEELAHAYKRARETTGQQQGGGSE